MKADQQEIVRLLKTARGQIDGILEMIEQDRYCIDISNQLMATQSILAKTNRNILQAHIQHCVKEAFVNGNAEEKMEEVLTLLQKINR